MTSSIESGPAVSMKTATEYSTMIQNTVKATSIKDCEFSARLSLKHIFSCL